MADIVAADVTATLVRTALPIQDSDGAPVMLVTADCTCDPGTTDAYPTGGIPLTALFTTADASDTWLDVAKPIVCLGSIMLRNAAATLTPLVPALFYNGGVTAAAQTLVLGTNDPAGSGALRTSVTGTGLAVTGAATITDSGNGLAVFKVGEPVLITGFTGTAANNQVAIIDTVAAGTITVFVATALTNDAAGETVSIRSLLPLERGFKEHANLDVTLAGDVAAGDTDFFWQMTLIGSLRSGVTRTGIRGA